MNELHRIYEQTIGTRLDKASFRHKILEQDIIEPIRTGSGAARTVRPSFIGCPAKVLTPFERKI